MRRLFLAFVCLLCGVAALSANTWQKYEAIPVTGTPVGFTSANINAGNGHPQAYYASCVTETAEMRWSIDPTVTVSATTGILAPAGSPIALQGNDLLNNFRIIITGNTAGSLKCQYFSAQ